MAWSYTRNGEYFEPLVVGFLVGEELTMQPTNTHPQHSNKQERWKEKKWNKWSLEGLYRHRKPWKPSMDGLTKVGSGGTVYEQYPPLKNSKFVIFLNRFSQSATSFF